MSWMPQSPAHVDNERWRADHLTDLAEVMQQWQMGLNE
jgi:hypothetical protein